MTNDLEKLLGGYATGTLTEQERKALFEAALDDQQLFNALADEQALKELLDDPESRKRVLETLESGLPGTTQSWLAPVFEWFRRPFNLTLAGSITAAAVAVFVFANLVREKPRQLAAPPVSEKTVESAPTPKTLAQPEQEPTPARSTGIASLPPRPPSPGATQAKLPHRVVKAPMDVPQVSSQRGAPVADALHSSQSAKATYGLSLGQAFVKGPARELFYAPTDLQRRGGRAATPTDARRSVEETKRSPQHAGEQSLPTPSGFAKLRSTTPRTPGIGLRLGLEKKGPDESYSKMKLDTPFDPQDKLRLTAEANTDGYLYSGSKERDLAAAFPLIGGLWR